MRARVFWYANVQGRHVTIAGFVAMSCASGKPLAEMDDSHPPAIAVLPFHLPLKEAPLGQRTHRS
jgi:hypothetical protein